jgi:hypothetical protein
LKINNNSNNKSAGRKLSKENHPLALFILQERRKRGLAIMQRKREGRDFAGKR